MPMFSRSLSSTNYATSLSYLCSVTYLTPTNYANFMHIGTQREIRVYEKQLNLMEALSLLEQKPHKLNKCLWAIFLMSENHVWK